MSSRFSAKKLGDVAFVHKKFVALGLVLMVLGFNLTGEIQAESSSNLAIPSPNAQIAEPDVTEALPIPEALAPSQDDAETAAIQTTDPIEVPLAEEEIRVPAVSLLTVENNDQLRALLTSTVDPANPEMQQAVNDFANEFLGWQIEFDAYLFDKDLVRSECEEIGSGQCRSVDYYTVYPTAGDIDDLLVDETMRGPVIKLEDVRSDSFPIVEKKNQNVRIVAFIMPRGGLFSSNDCKIDPEYSACPLILSPISINPR